jgi:uncharacterized membrane protein
VKRHGETTVLLQDVARLREHKMPGQYDRYNMRRLVSMTANIEGEDLGRVSSRIARALQELGSPPPGVQVDVRGQIVPMQLMFNGLTVGLILAVVVILLLLTANFQSVRLAFIVVSTVPGVIAGVALALWLTKTTLNIQSFMGAIMAIGVAVAHAILLVTFAERSRRAGASAAVATLLVLPAIFAIVQRQARTRSASLDPGDPESVHYDQTAIALEPAMQRGDGSNASLFVDGAVNVIGHRTQSRFARVDYPIAVPIVNVGEAAGAIVQIGQAVRRQQ